MTFVDVGFSKSKLNVSSNIYLNFYTFITFKHNKELMKKYMDELEYLTKISLRLTKTPKPVYFWGGRCIEVNGVFFMLA